MGVNNLRAQAQGVRQHTFLYFKATFQVKIQSKLKICLNMFNI